MSWTRRLWSYTRGDRGILVAGVLASLSQILFATASPWPAAILVDSVLQDRPFPGWASWIQSLPGAGADVGLAAWLAALTVGITILQFAAGMLSATLQTRAGNRVSYRLGGHAFDRLQWQPPSDVASRSVGDLVQRVTADCQSASQLLLGVAGPALSGIGTVVAMALVLWFVDAQVALIGLAGAVPVLLLAKRLTPAMFERSVERWAAQGRLIARANACLTNLRLIQSSVRQQSEVEEIERFGRQMTESALATTGLEVRLDLGTSAVRSVVSGLAIGIGGLAAVSGDITIGEILVFLGYLAAMYGPVQAVSGLAATYANAKSRAHRVFEVIDLPQSIADPVAPVEIDRVAGAIRFEHVTASYDPEQPILTDINLDIQPGQTIALVGRTGSGKTTLASLVPRFLDTTHGRVTIDGTDIRNLKLDDLRRQIALVSQEALLLPISIAENISYGRPDATYGDIIDAAIAANADEFIQHLPNGYDTILAERGATLSGGQRQRLGIARALLKDAPILILDEPTSALDLETEHAVLEALQRLIAGRTTLVIAHRLSTIRNADHIIVLEHGHITEQGTHQQLLHHHGTYHTLHQLDFGQDQFNPSDSSRQR